MSQLKTLSHRGLAQISAQSDRQRYGRAVFRAPEEPSRPPVTYRPPPQEMRVLSATNYRPRGWFTHTPVHTNTHIRFIKVKQVGLPFSPLSLLPVVCSHPEREREREGALVSTWTRSLSFSRSVSLIFLFSLWLLSVISLSQKGWRGTEHPLVGPKKTSSLLPLTHPPCGSLCYCYALLLLEVAGGPVARDNSINLQWTTASGNDFENKNLFGWSLYLLIHLFIC